MKQAREAGLTIKQSYERVGRKLVMMSGRYAHARQMKRSKLSGINILQEAATACH